MSYEIDFQEIESCIESVGKISNQYLSYLSADGQGIYGLKPLTHYEVLQRGVSKYIENKSKKEKSDIIQYLLGEDYKPEYEKYFSRSWQKSHSPYDVRFVQLPPNSEDQIQLGGRLQDIILKKTRVVRVRYFCPVLEPGHTKYRWNELNVESFHSLTQSQRRFILDYIELYRITPERIFIDDWSEEQSIKRQLGLQFFKILKGEYSSLTN